MTVRVKSYFDLEIAKEGIKSEKESKKEIHESKKPYQCPHKNIYGEDKCRPMVTHP